MGWGSGDCGVAEADLSHARLAMSAAPHVEQRVGHRTQGSAITNLLTHINLSA